MPSSTSSSSDRPCNVVLSGGAVSGVALIGALEAIVREGGYTRFNQVAGTSAGAVVGCVLAAASAKGDKSAAEVVASLRDDLFEADFPSFTDGQDLNPLRWVHLKAINKGKKVEDWLRKLLQAALGRGQNEEPTFGMLKSLQGPSPPLTVFACDVSSSQLMAFPGDVKTRYQLNEDEFSVVKAVRASMAVPGFFDPVEVKHGGANSAMTSLLVDGGIVSNFPIGALPSSEALPTFGVLLSETAPFRDAKDIHTALGMGEAVLHFMLNFYDRKAMSDEVKQRIITVPHMTDKNGDTINPLDFNLDQDKKERMRKAGYDAAAQMFRLNPRLKAKPTVASA